MLEKITRRRLPHWDVPEATYFVTTCLAGSIPASGLLDIDQYREQLDRQPRPVGMTVDDWRVTRWKQTFARRERWLDCEPAVRHLAVPDLAVEVAAALKFFHGSRYDLIAWAVMPSHYHWVFRPLSGWVESLGAEVRDRSPRQRIQHSVNRHSANRCNEILRRKGDFWQRESYDHWVRDEEEMERIVKYIHANPVVAGLVDSADKYPYSSAYREAH